MPSTSCVPPLLVPGICPMFAPCFPSQFFSSMIATICASGNFLDSGTASPMWSPWPWVSAMMSTRSGSLAFSGVFGFPFSHGSM